MKGGEFVNHALDSKTYRESQWTRKVSTIVSVESVISQVQKEAPPPPPHN